MEDNGEIESILYMAREVSGEHQLHILSRASVLRASSTCNSVQDTTAESE